MSRRIIGGIVAAVILVLTGVAYLMTTANLSSGIRTDIQVRVQRAQQQLIQNASLEGLGLLKRVEALVTDREYARVFTKTGKERADLAERVFQKFIQSLELGASRPDIIALTDATGDLIAQHGVLDPLPKKWKGSDDKLEYPGLALALGQRYLVSEVWSFRKEGLMEVGVGPIVNVDEDKVVGALVLAYSITSRLAREQAEPLGANVAYFHGSEISATSFTRSGGAEDTEMQGQLRRVLAEKDIGKSVLEPDAAGKVTLVTMNGEDYSVTAGRLPRFASQRLPDSYPETQSGALVMMSLSTAMAPLSAVKLSILFLGLASFVLALLATLITARGILSQADDIEDAINEITQGNFDRTIRPVGAELDGLAHGLNVMLARLLGRPEPGEEQYDDDGNLVQPGGVDFDNEELGNLSPADEASMKLAQEHEPEYYSRLYNEYVAARQQVGDAAEAPSYENFVTKLRFNESTLKVKYQCSAVRFRVVVADGKVTLKPVPIV